MTKALEVAHIEATVSSTILSRLSDAIAESPVTLIILIYCGLFMWFVLGLTGYHTYLLLTAQTTYEQIKGVYSSEHGCIDNPYYRGSAGNVKHGIFKWRRRRGSKFDRRSGTVVGALCSWSVRKSLCRSPPEISLELAR